MYFTILIVGAIIFIGYGIYIDYQATEKFIKIKYSGIIEEITIQHLNRGFPNIKLNNTWHPFDLDEDKVSSIIRVGDSIVKDSGTKAIKLYRKNSKHKWEVTIFN